VRESLVVLARLQQRRRRAVERDGIGEPAAPVEETVRDVDFAAHAAPLAGADGERPAGRFGGEEELVESDLQHELGAALGNGHGAVRLGEAAAGPAQSEHSQSKRAFCPITRSMTIPG